MVAQNISKSKTAALLVGPAAGVWDTWRDLGVQITGSSRAFYITCISAMRTIRALTQVLERALCGTCFMEHYANRKCACPSAGLRVADLRTLFSLPETL